ncbi:MAG: tetratricopeptide repeat protein [Dokdonella sp.]
MRSIKSLFDPNYGDKFPPTSSTKGTSATTRAVDELIALGNAREDSGDVAGACEEYHRAIQQAPDYFRAYLNLGNALQHLGQTIDAAEQYRHAIELNPTFAGAYLNLGNVLMVDRAFLDAAANYQAAIRLRPEWPDAWFGLGRAQEEIDSAEDAVGAYRETLRCDPAHGKAASHLAGMLAKSGQSHAARKVLQELLSCAPGNAQALRAQAELDQLSGNSEAAIVGYQQALVATPDDEQLYSSLLFAMNFCPDMKQETLLAEHRRYGELLARRVPASNSRIAVASGNPLKIGYVSPDFRRHSISCFIEPLLRHHDRSIVDVYCYYNHFTSDEITRRFAGLADHWCDIAGLSDETVVNRIASDGVDILVDLAGHTAENRLGVFARKPAPIQFTWLGYLCTTGLEAIDYRLCDFHTDPVDLAERWQVEKPIRLPDSQWCYQPQALLPEPSKLPRLTNGYWTFGSFNQASKLNSTTLETWGQLLAAISDSRLRILGITDSWLAESIRSRFARYGISADRLDLIGRIPIESYFLIYRDVDVALDSFPYNGATTTCDALLMGVPVATIAGNRSIARGGMSLLSTLEMQDWVAPSRDKFVEMVREHTQAPMRMETLRKELPERMRASALMDGQRFARNLEAVYQAVWKQAVQASAP